MLCSRRAPSLPARLPACLWCDLWPLICWLLVVVLLLPPPRTQVKSRFYSDATARNLFKDWAQCLLARVNTINGRAYAEDPTIFGWDVMNE